VSLESWRSSFVKEPLFLSEPAVLAYHAQQIQLYGGDPGMRDPGLLNSALAQPQNTYLYDATADLYDIAAAYAFHLTKNHPFIDGNKRTALQCGLGFLAINGVKVDVAPDELYSAMIRLTAGGESKRDFARFLRQHGNSI
jgi:death-on-curing protein